VATEDNENEGVSVSLPIPIVATGIILGLAAVGYLLLTRSEETDTVRTTAA
jgi:hypothetical protein